MKDKHTPKPLLSVQQQIALWVKEAKQGIPNAQFSLGICHARGEGVQQNLGQAAQYFYAAIQGGFADAALLLSLCCLDDPKIARNYHKWLIDHQEENDHAKFYVGFRLFIHKDYLLAAKKLYPIAERGHIAAQFCLAMCFYNEEGIVDIWKELYSREDKRNCVVRAHEQAEKYMRLAAKGGHSRAQHALGMLLLSGEAGIKRNFAEAYQWFEQAKNNGHPGAQDCFQGFAYEYYFGFSFTVNQKNFNEYECFFDKINDCLDGFRKQAKLLPDTLLALHNYTETHLNAEYPLFDYYAQPFGNVPFSLVSSKLVNFETIRDGSFESKKTMLPQSIQHSIRDSVPPVNEIKNGPDKPLENKTVKNKETILPQSMQQSIPDSVPPANEIKHEPLALEQQMTAKLKKDVTKRAKKQYDFGSSHEYGQTNGTRTKPINLKVALSCYEEAKRRGHPLATEACERVQKKITDLQVSHVVPAASEIKSSTPEPAETKNLAIDTEVDIPKEPDPQSMQHSIRDSVPPANEIKNGPDKPLESKTVKNKETILPQSIQQSIPDSVPPVNEIKNGPDKPLESKTVKNKETILPQSMQQSIPDSVPPVNEIKHEPVAPAPLEQETTAKPKKDSNYAQKQYHLGSCYEYGKKKKGKPVAINLEVALSHYKKAKTEGHELATEAYDRVQKKITDLRVSHVVLAAKEIKSSTPELAEVKNLAIGTEVDISKEPEIVSPKLPSPKTPLNTSESEFSENPIQAIKPEEKETEISLEPEAKSVNDPKNYSEGRKAFENGFKAFCLGAEEKALNYFFESSEHEEPLGYLYYGMVLDMDLVKMPISKEEIEARIENCFVKVREYREWFLNGADAETADAEKLRYAGIYCHVAAIDDADEAKTETYLSRAAEKGDLYSKVYLAQYYLSMETSKKMQTKGRKLLEEAAKAGDPRALCVLGVHLFDNGDKVGAFESFQSSAKKGHLNASFALANCYWNGFGIHKDSKEAKKILEPLRAFNQSAENLWKDIQKEEEPQRVEAQFHLASLLYAKENKKEGVKDYKEVMDYLKFPVKHEHSGALNLSGKCYFEQGNYQEAYEALEKALLKGHPGVAVLLKQCKTKLEKQKQAESEQKKEVDAQSQAVKGNFDAGFFGSSAASSTTTSSSALSVPEVQDLRTNEIKHESVAPVPLKQQTTIPLEPEAKSINDSKNYSEGRKIFEKGFAALCLGAEVKALDHFEASSYKHKEPLGYLYYGFILKMDVVVMKISEEEIKARIENCFAKAREHREWFLNGADAETADAEKLRYAGVYCHLAAIDEVDKAKTVTYLSRAAEKGDLYSKVYLSQYYLDMKGSKEAQIKGRKLLEEAASAGDATALYRFGRYLLKENNKAGAFESFQSSVKKGHEIAPVYLAKCHWNAWGTPKNPEKAKKILEPLKAYDEDAENLWAEIQKAEELQRVEAEVEEQFRLASLSYEEENKKQSVKDYKEVMQRLELPVKHEHPGALYLSGKCYFEEKNYQKADEVLTKAVMKKHPDAARLLWQCREQAQSKPEQKKEADAQSQKMQTDFDPGFFGSSAASLAAFSTSTSSSTSDVSEVQNSRDYT